MPNRPITAAELAEAMLEALEVFQELDEGVGRWEVRTSEKIRTFMTQLCGQAIDPLMIMRALELLIERSIRESYGRRDQPWSA
jgi:hypothetical protein